MFITEILQIQWTPVDTSTMGQLILDVISGGCNNQIS